MLDAVIRWSLRYRTLVVVLTLAALLYGGYLSTTMPIDVFPDLDRPRVVILTECPGMSPEEVETLVTHPIESRMLGAQGVQAVRSQSSIGLTVIYVEFDWSSDIRGARQVVQERLATTAGVLPDGIRPQMLAPASIMGQIMIVGLHRRKGPDGGDLFPVAQSNLLAELVQKNGKSSLNVWRPTERNNPAAWERVTVDKILRNGPRAQIVVDGHTHEVALRTPQEQQMDLRTTADWVIRPRLLQVPGIAEVLVLGGDRKQYQVLVDPNALLEFDVTLQQVEQAVKDNNINASGGFTVEGQFERPVRVIGRLGPLPSAVADDLRKVPVKAHVHRSVLLGQVAKVVEGPEPKRGDGGIDGNPGVVISIVKQPHTDTRSLTDNVKAALGSVETSLPADLVIDTELFQLRAFIDRGIFQVGEALAIGAVLIIIVLFLFLLNFRTTLITLTAIPLSLVVTMLVFRAIGWLSGRELSINVMTLGGIAVAMGELVDDAIVDVENIYRRLRENNALAEPRPALQVVFEASKEIRSAIVFGTMVVVLVFLPLFALSGIEGRLFTPLGIAYIVSILASLLVSLTVTPVLSYYLLPKSGAAHRQGDSFLLRFLKSIAERLIRFSMNHAGMLLLATWLLVALAAWQMTRFGSDFLPPFDEGSIQLNVSLPPGSSLQASNDAAAIVDAHLQAMMQTADKPDGAIKHFLRRTGRAELDEHAEPVSRSEYILNMNPDAGLSRDETLRRLLNGLKDELPGADLEAEQPMAHLISHVISGVNAQIAIKIYGDDLDTLGQIAKQIKAEISSVPGVTTPIIEPQVEVDELHIVLRPDDLAFHGLSRAQVAEFVKTALRGESVSQVLDGQRRFDLVVKLQEPDRSDYTKLKNLRIDLPDGRGQIRLGDVADFPEGASGPNQLMRENVRRRAVIRCNVLGRDLGSAVSDIQDRIDKRVALPAGYSVEYGGQFESQRSATLLIGVLAGVSLIGVFVVLLVLQPSVRIVLQILNAIPTAFIGGVLALVLTGQTLTVASLVGFVSLGGIAVRNGILLVTHYFHLMREEREGFTKDMILRGSLERLSPVLMTALTAGIALVPLVLGGKKPGLEILYPVATVILGGLVTSTFCEFLIHPGLFWRYSGRDAERIIDKNNAEDASLT